jgi:hypothetical protein
MLKIKILMALTDLLGNYLVIKMKSIPDVNAPHTQLGTKSGRRVLLRPENGDMMKMVI